MTPPQSFPFARLFFVLLLASPLSGWGAEKPEHPNVILFVSDDMGWNDVGYHGSEVATPNLDQMALDGARLDRFYVHPICSPTRAALMTGRLPLRFGINGPLGREGGIPAEESFLSESFQAAGYQTFLVGKWHLGSQGEEHSPLQRGFDHFYGFRGGMIDYFEHTHGNRRDWQRNGVPLEEEGYSTNLFAAEAVRLLEDRDPSRPVFLYLAFNAPHGPPQAPAEAIRSSEAQGLRSSKAARAASIEIMDQAIGNVLTALEDNGMSENSLVLFFCDNGDKETKRGSASLPTLLRGGKGTLLEGGIRVPALLRWPGRIPGGTKVDVPVSVLDLPPTLTTATGVPLLGTQPLDGIDRWPSIESGKPISDAPIVIGGSRGQLAVIDFPLKLIQDSEGTQLYNIQTDPGEASNLAESRPEDLARMKTLVEPYAELAPAGKKRKNPDRERKRRRAQPE